MQRNRRGGGAAGVLTEWIQQVERGLARGRGRGRADLRRHGAARRRAGLGVRGRADAGWGAAPGYC
jgi:hypothetical protein